MSFMGLLELPIEILSNIVSFLSASDLPRVCMTCSKLQEAALPETVWQERCKIEYGVFIEPSELASSYRELYTKMLHRYGDLKGFWQKQDSPYGGFMEVKMQKESLVCFEYFTPPYPECLGHTKQVKYFSLTLSQEGGLERGLEMTCESGSEPHKCQINKVKTIVCAEHDDKSVTEERVFELICDDKTTLHVVYEQKKDWCDEVFVNRSDEGNSDLSERRYNHLKYKWNKNSHMGLVRFRSLDIQRRRQDVIIQPGVFVGTYGAHGNEFINIVYEEKDGRECLIGVKVTGDPNVPMGKVSITAEVTRPITVNDHQQEYMNTLKQISLPDDPLNSYDQLPVQPFRVPTDCYYNRVGDTSFSTPRYCKARFIGKCQLAGDGYGDPRWGNIHIMIFTDDILGVLWLDLSMFSLYGRAKRDDDTYIT